MIIAGGPNANAVGLIDEEFPPIPGWSAVLPDPFRITFDEFGRGSYVQNGLPTVHPVTGTLLPDPTVGIGGYAQASADLHVAGTGGRRHCHNF